MDLSGGPRYLKLNDSVMSRGQIVLVECDSEADIDSISQRGAVLKSKGGAADEMHLCTEEKTLECKYVETTNSLYLVESADSIQGGGDENDQRNQGSQQPHSAAAGAGLMTQLESDKSAEHAAPLYVEAQTNFVVETSKASLPVEGLWNLVQPHTYTAQLLAEGDRADVGVTWHELRSNIMACDRDIVVGLQKLKAFAFQQEDEVRWCAADESLCATALEHVLLTCIENGISLGSFEAVHIIETLEAASDDLSLQLVAAGSCFLWHVLRLYTCLNAPAAFATRAFDLHDPAPTESDPHSKLHFDKALVSRACMQAALANICSDAQRGSPGSGTVRIVLSDVQPGWEDSFPALHHWRHTESGAVQHSMDEQEAEDDAERQDLFLEGLKGLAVLQTSKSVEQQHILVLFESRLPKEAGQRFKALLQIMEVWSREQMEPYLDVCDAECANPTELLLKYTRTIRDGSGNPPTYVARMHV